MEIIQKKISELSPYHQNSKKHSDLQISKIADSITEFGFVQPLVIDKENTVAIGHGRLLAAQKLDMKEVPCCLIENLTEDQVKRLRIMDNRLNESEWNFENLKKELENFPELSDEFEDLTLDFNDLSELNDGSLIDNFGDKKNSFAITFVFDVKEKKKILAYLKENGKQSIVNLIIKFINNA